LWPVVAPTRLLEIATLVVACSCVFVGTERALKLLTTMGVLLLFVGVCPIGYWLFLPLETRFPPWNDSIGTAPDGIIALGGDSGPRLAEFARVSRVFPQARLVYTGAGDRAIAERELRAAGIDPAQVTLETRSRNTAENATQTAELVRPKEAELWLLVTSSS